MSKVKSILFKMELKGRGIVNYDSNDQKNIYNKCMLDNGLNFNYNKNVSYAKKNFYINNDGKLDYKIKISDQCLRHHIFEYFQSPNVMHHKQLLLSLIASPESILRGYTYAIPKEDGASLKRSSVLSISDAEQTNNAKSFLEFFSRSGAKIEKVDENSNSDTSIFTKENVGDITYESVGGLDLMQMQFVSCSELFDRFAFDPDNFDLYSKLLQKRLPSFDSKLKYYTVKDSVTNLPERGFLFSNEEIIVMTKWILSKMFNLSIRKTNAYAEVSSLKIKFIYDPFGNKLNDEDGWIEINKEVIDNLNFDTENFYEEFDEEDSKKLLTELEQNVKSADTRARAKKASKKVAKESSKEETIESQTE